MSPQHRVSRRRFLGTTALAGAGAAGLMPGAAQALRITEGDVARETLFLRACEQRSVHDRLIEEIRAQLSGQEERARAEQIVQSLNCPYCGCALVQAPAGEAPAEPSR